jgi:deoxyribonuclease V
MRLQHEHPWDVSPKQAIEIQERLRSLLDNQYHSDYITRVAGVDVGFENGGSVTRAAVAVLSFPGLELVERAIARRPTCFPYIPGLLSFREIPAVLDALDRLERLPDLLLCDGQGIAHPRRLGIAAHLGLLTGLPSIGVGKTRLIGQHREPGNEKGEWEPLIDKGETIGAVVRTRRGVKPLFISPGHRMDLQASIDYVLACTTRYRLPETTRWAHRLASGQG